MSKKRRIGKNVIGQVYPDGRGGSWVVISHHGDGYTCVHINAPPDQALRCVFTHADGRQKFFEIPDRPTPYASPFY